MSKEGQKDFEASLEKSAQAAASVVATQTAAVNDLTAFIPHNTNKSAEYGAENAVNPPKGFSASPAAYVATASTVSEAQRTEKAGNRAKKGVNATPGPLDAVRVDSGEQQLTTNQGVPIADNQHSLKAGLRGPTLMEDFILREKITHFDHERIPERIVHARGSGAHGYFECYEPLTEMTKAAPFREAGKQTPVFVRFSTVAGERGSKDTARDARGFAVKFYTDEGNWDLVGNNIPVFFIQDAMKFPDLVHSVKPEPNNAIPQAASAHDTFWDFVSLMPESTHMLMWVMSDRGIPRSYRTMEGFGVHTYRLVNERGESRFCKFHWKPLQGTHSQVWDEAVKVSGADPDFHRRDLWDAIEAGEFPAWELGLQIFSEAEAEKWSFDVLDATKLVPEELVPVRTVGRLVLNRNPDNFFAETEQVAFCVAHVIPGIDFSNDPLLAGRIHSYLDTQLSRLGGPNFHEIPINAPLAPVHNNQRDGPHRQAIHRGRVSYEPNSLAGGCPFQAGKSRGFVSHAAPLRQDTVRGSPEKFAEHYHQAALFFDSQTVVEQAHIADAFSFELSLVSVPAIRLRMLSSLRNASPSLATRVASSLGLDLPPPLPRASESFSLPAPEVRVSPSLSLLARPGITGIRTLSVALLVAPGIEAAPIEALVRRLRRAGAVPSVVGPRQGSVVCAGENSVIEAELTLASSPLFLFDALVLPGGETSVLLADRRVMDGVRDHYEHGKPLLALGEGFFSRAGLEIGQGDEGIVTAKGKADHVEEFIAALAKRRHPRKTDNKP